MTLEDDLDLFRLSLNGALTKDILKKYGLSSGSLRSNYDRIRINILRHGDRNDNRFLRNLMTRKQDARNKVRWESMISSVDFDNLSDWKYRPAQYSTAKNNNKKSWDNTKQRSWASGGFSG